jgi:co-chaperonin GroES (HSP10)
MFEAPTKSQVTELVTSVYEHSERTLQPTKPFMLVRVLPRTMISPGGIILPEKQNKPNIEGVVLAVYEPYWDKATTVRDGEEIDISTFVECDIKVGDHIVFPHYVGLPDSFLDDQEYRMVKEDDAVATLEYRPKGWLKEQVDDVLKGHVGYEVNSLLRYFYVIPKIMDSKTTSGK